MIAVVGGGNRWRRSSLVSGPRSDTRHDDGTTGQLHHLDAAASVEHQRHGLNSNYDNIVQPYVCT